MNEPEKKKTLPEEDQRELPEERKFKKSPPSRAGKAIMENLKRNIRIKNSLQSKDAPTSGEAKGMDPAADQEAG
ncbi:hypothetical protein Rhal01_03443 [Rubritalea halochordaticola]|uniref:Uncharacterized protein n=1 Tax=Rubritalea halochordaticola TaxID=714537 RepID=A0ABP9V3R3_9BACT